MKESLLSLFTLLLFCSAWAENVEIDGINYSLDYNTQEATVIRKTPNYSGDITIPSSVNYSDVTYCVTGIGEGAFAVCTGLTSVEIPNSITRIGWSAFECCEGLTSIEIPSGVTSIEDDVFSGCIALTSVTIPNSVTKIGMYAFFFCVALTSVEIPSSVTSIGAEAFNCSGLTSVEIPNSVTYIGSWAFNGCSYLTSVEIPNSVKSMGDWAFSGCTGLTSFVCEATTPPTLGEYAFNEIDKSTCLLYVPSESVTAYESSDQWKDFSSILPIDPTGINAIENVQLTNEKYFDFDGREIPTPQKGMNIVKKANGQTIKKFVK